MRSSFIIIGIIIISIVVVSCVNVVSRPTISFVANPESIVAGDTVKLQWAVSGANSVSIDQGIGQVATSGTMAVTPTSDTTYTLIATHIGGKEAKSVTIAVKTTPMSLKIDSSKPISVPSSTRVDSGSTRVAPPISPQSFMKTTQTSQDEPRVLYDFINNARYAKWQRIEHRQGKPDVTNDIVFPTPAGYYPLTKVVPMKGEDRNFNTSIYLEFPSINEQQVYQEYKAVFSDVYMQPFAKFTASFQFAWDCDRKFQALLEATVLIPDGYQTKVLQVYPGCEGFSDSIVYYFQDNPRSDTVTLSISNKPSPTSNVPLYIGDFKITN